MSEKLIRFKIKRKTAEEWSQSQEILLAGEPAFDTTNLVLKIGDGEHTWAELPVTNSRVESVNGKTGVVVIDAADVGLGNVDNTADADKPISTATQQALDTKVNASEVSIYAQDNTIVRRTAGGKVDVRVKDPEYGDEPASKDYADTKVPWSAVNYDAYGDTIVRRKGDSKVDIRVPEPTYSDDPASKNYVDNGLSTKQNTINGNNKLSADYLRDGTTNKVFTATDKQQIATNANDIVELDGDITTLQGAVNTNTANITTLIAESGAILEATINSSTYEMTITLKNKAGSVLGTPQVVDLPLESVVVSGAYDAATKEVVLTLKDGSTIRFSVADLVSGLQTEITAQNPLSADLVADGNINKAFTAAEKTKLAGIEDGAQVNTVDSVNGSTGNVVLDADDISDTNTTHKFTTAADQAKLAGIEAGAQVNAPNTVVDADYVHTDNNFTTTEKDKLANIEAGAQVNTVNSVNSATGDVVLDADDIDDATTTNKFTTAAEKDKLAGIEAGAQVNDPNTVVDANYVHTDNNFTTAEKDKLANIESGAEVNTVDSVNGQVGAVVLDADDIDDTNTTNKFVNALEKQSIDALHILSGSGTLLSHFTQNISNAYYGMYWCKGSFSDLPTEILNTTEPTISFMVNFDFKSVSDGLFVTMYQYVNIYWNGNIYRSIRSTQTGGSVWTAWSSWEKIDNTTDKVSKVTTANKVYIVDANGNQSAADLDKQSNNTTYIPVIAGGRVLDMGDIIDFHKENSTTDYDTRVVADPTANQNTVILPVNSGTLALKSDIPTHTPLYKHHVVINVPLSNNVNAYFEFDAYSQTSIANFTNQTLASQYSLLANLLITNGSILTNGYYKVGTAMYPLIRIAYINTSEGWKINVFGYAMSDGAGANVNLHQDDINTQVSLFTNQIYS